MNDDKKETYTPYELLKISKGKINLNFIYIFSFFSPFIIIFLFTFMGFYYSSFTGILFMFTILFSIVIRTIIYYYTKDFSFVQKTNNKCNLIDYSGIGSGDIYLSLWVFSFTIFYLIIPLIKRVNVQESFYYIFISLLLLFVLDIGLKLYLGCYENTIYSFINIFLNLSIGGFLGLLFSLLYSMDNSILKPHLFFSSKSTNESCEKVNSTEFQCSFDFE